MAVWDKMTVCSFLFLLTGAVDNRVNYPHPVCAVRASTVTLPCTFTPVKSFIQDGREVSLQIIRVVWCQNHLICHGSTPSVYDSESDTDDPRYQYLGDKQGNCTLQITDLQQKDDATFRFRMEANYKEGHFTGQSGVNVTVVGALKMRITSSRDAGVVREGEPVTLRCTAVCTFHHLEITWFRDDHALSESGPALQLSSLTAEDSGNYTCGLKTSMSSRSLPYALHVEAAEGGGVQLPVVGGVVLGVLLALCALTLVFFIVRRKRAAAHQHQRALGDELEKKRPDDIYSNILLPAEQEGGGHPQEASQAVEEVSYASVEFKHKVQARPVQEPQDAVIYTSVGRRS